MEATSHRLIVIVAFSGDYLRWRSDDGLCIRNMAVKVLDDDGNEGTRFLTILKPGYYFIYAQVSNFVK